MVFSINTCFNCRNGLTLYVVRVPHCWFSCLGVGTNVKSRDEVLEDVGNENPIVDGVEFSCEHHAGLAVAIVTEK